MFILESEQMTELPTLAQLLRGWWASLLAWLQRESRPDKQANEETNSQEHRGGLIL
jgi:hypothetical protein